MVYWNRLLYKYLGLGYYCHNTIHNQEFLDSWNSSFFVRMKYMPSKVYRMESGPSNEHFCRSILDIVQIDILTYTRKNGNIPENWCVTLINEVIGKSEYFTFVARHQTHLPLSKQSEHECLLEHETGHDSIDTTASGNLNNKIRYAINIVLNNCIFSIKCSININNLIILI